MPDSRDAGGLEDAARSPSSAPSSNSSPGPSGEPAASLPAPGSDARSSTGWLIDFDLAGLLTELGIAESSAEEDQDAYLASEQEAQTSAEAEPVDLTGRVAGHLPPGPALAAWLAGSNPEHCRDADLPDVAAAYRRIASWAQARELAAVAALASRSAGDNDRIGTDELGRPRQIPPEAAARLALAMAMSQFGATAWTSLAVQLRWQLPTTAAALADGSIDLGRARLIADATAMLTDEAARTVEERVVPRAGDQTAAQLRSALRRAVIAADPQGAEQRRRDAERRAKVGLFPDEEGTATITGSSLPGLHAAAAMARINAMARALKASGAHGGIDLLRAHIFLGLLLGTMPLIPPAEGAPPDDPRPPSHPYSADQPHPPDQPPPPDQPHPPDHPQPPPLPDDGARPTPRRRGPGDQQPQGSRTGPAEDSPSVAGKPSAVEGDCPWSDVPPPGDEDAPSPEDDPAPQLPTRPAEACDDDPADAGPPPPWPELPAHLPFSDPPRATGSPRPPAGLLDVILPWSAIAGTTSEPGLLSRIGPVTLAQSRELLRLGLLSAATEWRVVLTDDGGRALAVERVRFGHQCRARAGPGTAGVIGRLTVTVAESRADDICAGLERLLAGGAAPDGVSPDRAAPDGTPHDRAAPDGARPDRAAPDGALHGGALLLPVRRAAVRAAVRVRAERAANAAVASIAPSGTALSGTALSGACAHSSATDAYRPPPRIREFIAARDVTCRFPSCRQPAWRADLDHTIPWHRGGRTCSCNLGPECRTHHKIKQLPGWKLDQPQPGYFRWTTPTGHIYHVSPDPYPV